MKNHNYTLLTSAALLATFTSIATAFSGPSTQPTDDTCAVGAHDCGSACAVPEVKTADVRFRKDKVYEIAFFSVTEGKEAQLFGQYLPAAQPYFDQYGAKVLGMFSVTESRSEVLDSKMAAIFEWPNIEAKQALAADAGFQEVAKLREGAFSFFNAGWFAAPEDTAVTFRSDKLYEIGGASLFRTASAKASLDEYFQVSGPIKENYGGVAPKFLVMMKPTGPESASSYTHDMQFIVEWDSVEDNAKLFADEDFKTKALPLLSAAIETMDLVFTKFVFQD